MQGDGMMHVWIRRVGSLLLAGALLGTLLGCGHDPNHGIDREKARAAADRVHTPPDPSVKMTPGQGG